MGARSGSKVKVKAVVTYLTPGYPIPQIHLLTGPEHEVEVRGFVDVRFDNVGEWGEEDPGAFMAKDGIDKVELRGCRSSVLNGSLVVAERCGVRLMGRALMAVRLPGGGRSG